MKIVMRTEIVANHDHDLLRPFAPPAVYLRKNCEVEVERMLDGAYLAMGSDYEKAHGDDSFLENEKPKKKRKVMKRKKKAGACVIMKKSATAKAKARAARFEEANCKAGAASRVDAAMDVEDYHDDEPVEDSH